jgi:hypothetical protein
MGKLLDYGSLHHHCTSANDGTIFHNTALKKCTSTCSNSKSAANIKPQNAATLLTNPHVLADGARRIRLPFHRL